MDWAAYTTPLRFETGTSVISTEQGWMIQLPNEEFLHIQGEDRSKAAVGELLAGCLSPARALAAAPDAGVGDLLDALASEGALSRRLPPQRRKSVLVVGDGPPRSALCGLLAAAELRLDLVASSEQVGDARPDVVVAVARWLPDAEWRRLDGWSATTGIPWQRVHGEGRSWYVGPFTDPGLSPSYEDLRLRRLAACEWPQDLLALWAWLDGGGAPAGGTRPGPGATVAAALAAADVLAHLRDEPVPGADFQVGVDMVTGGQRRHPVLAVPRHLLMEPA